MPRARRLPWPELALGGLSLVFALAALEVGARLRLSSHDQAALPRVGLSDEDENRLRWLERRARREDGDDDQLKFDRHDSVLGWSPIPALARRHTIPGVLDVEIHTNAEGLRGRMSVPRKRQPGRARVAVFGCSQTFGAEVEDAETYSARLEQRLHDTDVLNFGVHGYGTDQMMLRWEGDGAGYRPDVVVLGFAYYHVQRNVDAFRFFAKPRFEWGTGGGLVLLGVPVPSPDAYAATATAPRVHTLLDRSVLLRAGWQTVLRRREARLYTEDSPAWELTRALLKRFAFEVHEHGAAFVLLNLEDDSPQLEPVLARVAREDGAYFVNAGRTLGDLRGAGRRFRIRENAHWGPEGHAIIADDLARAICDDRLLPASACDPSGATTSPERSSRSAS